jgi:hypothetical protein
MATGIPRKPSREACPPSIGRLRGRNVRLKLDQFTAGVRSLARIATD